METRGEVNRACPSRLGANRRVCCRSFMLRAILTAAVIFLAIVPTACSLFHHGPTPQERYYEALSRGNVMEASEILRNMSQKDRMKLQQGEGLDSAFFRKAFGNQLNYLGATPPFAAPAVKPY